MKCADDGVKKVQFLWDQWGGTGGFFAWANIWSWRGSVREVVWRERPIGICFEAVVMCGLSKSILARALGRSMAFKWRNSNVTRVSLNDSVVDIFRWDMLGIKARPLRDRLRSGCNCTI